ncbi:MAG: hypothetical protein KZQ82_17200 [Candidatus Thiodiazotropha sp. (ex Lucinoma annulata)]|nr:hypothetical protein [Candidatus Thiodiazotropha sp. (ex Lucinoma borealis)]MCU7867061.1 hypothetical protein [Candidatus Thiodiazotropha sp. (ex Lucinoma borealis)]MCU7885930.1 hypothetical protein [Candidatus Thiodiazotropha sp. (ex Lucinoma annulata)]
MNKLQLTLLALLILISQGLWADHLYHEHDQGEVCEVCLVAHSQDHFVAPSVFSISINQIFTGVITVASAGLTARATGYCCIRAPPFIA